MQNVSLPERSLQAEVAQQAGGGNPRTARTSGEPGGESAQLKGFSAKENPVKLKLLLLLSLF